MSGNTPSHLNRPSQLRVLVVDESRLVAEALMFAFDSDPRLDAIGYCVDGAGALELVSAYEPDVVVVGSDLAGVDQLDLCDLLHNVFPSVQLISLQKRLEPEEVEALNATGVADCLATTCSVDQLLHAIAASHGRETVSERRQRQEKHRLVSQLATDA